MTAKKLHTVVLDVMGADSGTEPIIDGGIELRAAPTKMTRTQEDRPNIVRIIQATF